jgi:hypothetical protein
MKKMKTLKSFYSLAGVRLGLREGFRFGSLARRLRWERVG